MSPMTTACIVLSFALACTSSPKSDLGNGGSNGPVCGDGVCDASEIQTCPADCAGSGSSVATCGNGVCEAGENETNCPNDCPISMCGNGVCETGEDSSNCPQDCGNGGSNTEAFDCSSVDTQDSCLECFEDDDEFGLGECDEFGDASPGSAADCAMCVANGNFGSGCATDCAGGETTACAQCVFVQSECGDGFCEYYDGENAANCPADCPVVPCGDGICDVQDGETSATCGSDCLLADTFDCSSTTDQDNCEECFFDDSSSEGGMLGECNSNMDVTGGSAADCAKCAAIGSFGSDCTTFCGSGETNACATCVAGGL